MIRLERIETKDIINYNQVFIEAEAFFKNDNYQSYRYYKDDSINFVFTQNGIYLVYHVKESGITSEYFTTLKNSICFIKYEDYHVNLLGFIPCWCDNIGIIHHVYKVLDEDKIHYIYRQQKDDFILNLTFESDNILKKEKPIHIQIIDNQVEFNYVKMANQPYYYTEIFTYLRFIEEKYHEKDVFDKLKKKGFNIYVPEFIKNFFENNVMEEYEELVSAINLTRERKR